MEKKKLKIVASKFFKFRTKSWVRVPLLVASTASKFIFSRKESTFYLEKARNWFETGSKPVCLKNLGEKESLDPESLSQISNRTAQKKIYYNPNKATKNIFHSLKRNESTILMND